MIEGSVLVASDSQARTSYDSNLNNNAFSSPASTAYQLHHNHLSSSLAPSKPGTPKNTVSLRNNQPGALPTAKPHHSSEQFLKYPALASAGEENSQVRNSLSTISSQRTGVLSASSSPTSSFNSACSGNSANPSARPVSPPDLTASKIAEPSISRNPSSSSDDATNRDTHNSLRSMYSIATSFDSVPEPLAGAGALPTHTLKNRNNSPGRQHQQQPFAAHQTSTSENLHQNENSIDTTFRDFDSAKNSPSPVLNPVLDPKSLVTPTKAPQPKMATNTPPPPLNPKSASPTLPNLDLFSSFDALSLKDHNPAFVSPGNSNSTTTARSSNNDSFSSTSSTESSVSSAIHEETASNAVASNKNSTPNDPVTSNTNSIVDENFPLPAEPGQVSNALKHRKSCASINSVSSHSLSLNHKASTTSFSKSFSRPLSNSRPPSIHNEPTTTSASTVTQPLSLPSNIHEPLGIAIDHPPLGSAPHPTIAENSFYTHHELALSNSSIHSNSLINSRKPTSPSQHQTNVTSSTSSYPHPLDPIASANRLDSRSLHSRLNSASTQSTVKPPLQQALQPPVSIPDQRPTLTSSNSFSSHKSRPEYTRTASSSSIQNQPLQNSSNHSLTQLQSNPQPRQYSVPSSFPVGTSSAPHPARQSSVASVPLPTSATHAKPLAQLQWSDSGTSQHRPSASSASIRTSVGNISDVRATGLQRNSSVTVLRRRSLLPHGMASAPTEDRAGYYKEQVKAMRELKKRRQEDELDDRALVGKTISEGHVNYSIAYNMLTGIRVSVSRCNAKLDRDLVDSDFTAQHKLAFDINGNELIPSSKYDFKFKDYSPLVFRHLRAMFQLDPADYLMSLTNKYILSELSSPGKSGSLFYFSRDYRFIIKTIHHSEHKTLRKILKQYYNHVKTCPNTLISRFYGLHRIKLPWGKKVHFIVMNNLFPPYYDLRRTYDLKGSTLGREYIPHDGAAKSTAVLKDLNWVKNEEHLMLGPAKSQQFLAQLERDVKFLKQINVMDYSLLIGVYDFAKADQATKPQSVYVVEPAHGVNLKGKELRKAVNSASPTEMTTLDIGEYRYGHRNFVFYSDQGGFQSTDENDQPLSEIYFLGVIDCLTPYTFYKRAETFWKGLSNTRITISAIPAAEYGDRFMKFMRSTIKAKQSTIVLPGAESSSAAGASRAQAEEPKVADMVMVHGVQGPPGTTGVQGPVALAVAPVMSNGSVVDDAHSSALSGSSGPKPGTAAATNSGSKAVANTQRGILPKGHAPAFTPVAAADAHSDHHGSTSMDDCSKSDSETRFNIKGKGKIPNGRQIQKLNGQQTESVPFRTLDTHENEPLLVNQ